MVLITLQDGTIISSVTGEVATIEERADARTAYLDEAATWRAEAQELRRMAQEKEDIASDLETKANSL